MSNEIQWPPSLWAAATQPAPVRPQLQGSIDADVVVIGAGFSGLSTALHLARAGRQVVLLEGAEPGWGASGRNNGQVIPTLTRPEPEQIVARHGEAGERFVGLVRDCASILFDLVRAENIEAEAEQNGWIQPVHSPGRMKIAERRVRQWGAVGAPVELLDAQQVRDRLGSPAWYGGWTNRSGGHVNPLALARGLAQAAEQRGVQIFTRSPVKEFKAVREHGGERWIASTDAGQVVARSLVLATHAYTDHFSHSLAPAIAREVVPVLSWQMATQPLDESRRNAIIPGRESVSDTHGDLHFMRYDARNRLVTGGALVNPVNGAQKLRKRIGARLTRLFPQIGEVHFDYVWNGYIAMTTDFLPRVHRLGPNAYAWAGCNGRAVGLSVALGRELARAICGEPEHELALPFTEPTPIPLHGLVRRVAPLRLLSYRYHDAREI